MAALLRKLIALNINDIIAYFGAAVTGFSLVTSPTPTHSTYRLRMTGTSAATGNSTGDTFTKAKQWFPFSFRLDSSVNLSAGQDVAFIRALGCKFSWVRVSNTTFNIKVVKIDDLSVIGTSATAYSTSTEVAIRVDKVAATNAVNIYINGVLEISGTAAAALAATILCENTTLIANQDMYLELMAISESDDGADRPGAVLWTDVTSPNANTSETDYGDQADCSNSANGTYTKWDEWPAAATNDATDFNCGFNSNWKEVSGMAAGALALSGTMLGGAAIYRQRANVVLKTTDNWARFKDDAGNASEIQHANPSNSFFTYYVHLTTPPAGAWSDYFNGSSIFNGSGSTKKLQMGSRVVSTNGAGLNVSTIAFEMVALSSDAEAVATGQPMRQRLGELTGVRRIGRGS